MRIRDKLFVVLSVGLFLFYPEPLPMSTAILIENGAAFPAVMVRNRCKKSIKMIPVRMSSGSGSDLRERRPKIGEKRGPDGLKQTRKLKKELCRSFVDEDDSDSVGEEDESDSDDDNDDMVEDRREFVDKSR